MKLAIKVAMLMSSRPTLDLNFMNGVLPAGVTAGGAPVFQANGLLIQTGDSFTMTGSEFTNWYNPSRGTFVVECVLDRQNADAGASIVDVTDGTTNNYIRTFYRANGATGFNITTGAATQVDLAPTEVLTANTIARIAVVYETNDFACAGQGLLTGSATAGTIPNVSQINIGGALLGPSLNGWMRRIRYWRRRLPNSTLQRLTA